MGRGAISTATVAQEANETLLPALLMERANILLVDDHPENLLALEAVLEPLGENLHKAASGFEALRLLLRNDYAVILMDAQMPEMNGFETAALIRARDKTRNIPIIFVTAHGSDHRQLVESYYVGAVDYIPKPFEPDILRSKVRVFVDLQKKNEQLRRQAELIHEAEMIQAERRQQELAEALEREHMLKLTHELEIRVEQRTAELVAANKELENFCYSVSHDLRAPLRAISATSMMLLEDAGEKLEEAEREKLLGQAAAASRLGKLIDDLLALARLSRVDMKREEVDISQLAVSVAAEVRDVKSKKKHQLKVEPNIKCLGDASLIRVLLQNLLENAFKYSPDGGTISVGCTDEAFFVKDQGIGLNMAYAHKIFLPFERLVLEPTYPGTGIGLATAQRVVNRHNGRIWVESEPGQGSTFYFTLGHPIEKPASGSKGSTKIMQRSDKVS